MKIKNLMVWIVVLASCVLAFDAFASQAVIDSSDGRYVMRLTEINRTAVQGAARLIFWMCPNPAGRFYCVNQTSDTGQTIQLCKCYAGGKGCEMEMNGTELTSVSCDMTEFVDEGVDFEWGLFLGPSYEDEYHDNQFYISISHSTISPSEILEWVDSHTDTDGDGVMGTADACPDVAGVEDNGGCPTGDADRDGAVDPVDTDGDGVNDDVDGCDDTPAGTAIGADGCLPDTDADGVADASDNCPDDANADQADTDGDSAGDACDPDFNQTLGTFGEGGGCTLAGASAANPILFLLLCAALLPIVRSRRK